MALNEPIIRTALRHFALTSSSFNSGVFLETMACVAAYPSVSIKEMIYAATKAGVKAEAKFADLRELSDVGPFLAYLKSDSSPETPMSLIRIDNIKAKTAVISQDKFRTETISINNLSTRWSGLVIISSKADRAPCIELSEYRQHISLIPSFLSSGECTELIEYCENVSFQRSTVADGREGKEGNVVLLRSRSSTSALLRDRSQPVLASVYRRCAELEGVSEDHIEAIQCVRYKIGQRFHPHYDSGINLSRRTTFLLYLNDGFEGGDTYFPLLDLAVAPVSGSCLRFPSCTPAGRIIWQSEHGGLPVLQGIKYALNIWVRNEKIVD